MKRAAKASEAPSGKKRKGGGTAGRGGSRGSRLVAFLEDADTGAPAARPSPSRSIPAKTRGATSPAAATRASRRATSSRFAVDGEPVSSTTLGWQKPVSAGTRVSPRASQGGASSGAVAPKKRRLSRSAGGARAGAGEVAVVNRGGAIEGTENLSGTLGQEAEILATLLRPAQQSMPAQEVGHGSI